MSDALHFNLAIALAMAITLVVEVFHLYSQMKSMKNKKYNSQLLRCSPRPLPSS